MNKPLHDKHFFNCPCWKGILTKIEGIEKPTYAVWNAFGGPWPLVITISEGVIWVWKKIYWRKKNLRKNEIWWNLMKSDEIMISSDFIRFHQISFFLRFFFLQYIFFQTQITPSEIVITKGQGPPNAFQTAYVGFSIPSILVKIPFQQGQLKKCLSCNGLFMCLVLVFNVFVWNKLGI